MDHCARSCHRWGLKDLDWYALKATKTSLGILLMGHLARSRHWRGLKDLYQYARKETKTALGTLSTRHLAWSCYKWGLKDLERYGLKEKRPCSIPFQQGTSLGHTTDMASKTLIDTLSRQPRPSSVQLRHGTLVGHATDRASNTLINTLSRQPRSSSIPSQECTSLGPATDGASKILFNMLSRQPKPHSIPLPTGHLSWSRHWWILKNLDWYALKETKTALGTLSTGHLARYLPEGEPRFDHLSPKASCLVTRSTNSLEDSNIQTKKKETR